MKKRGVIVLDCGATNVKACIVDEQGQVVAAHSLVNQVSPDPHYQGGLIWDADEILRKMILCTRSVVSRSENVEIKAITVTSFGVDGAPVKKDGSFCYPVISWQCGRTDRALEKSGQYFSPDWLYATAGLKSYHFNTLFKLIWFRENRPEVLDSMDYYLLMPSIIIHKLTGEFYTDTTMAGTTMLTSLHDRTFNDDIFRKIGLEASVFPPLAEPGSHAGLLLPGMASEMGLQQGMPVIVTGHDTQFAVLGSGAGINEPVISSGTWEILMVRVLAQHITIPGLQSGITMEWDAVPGVIDMGLQWVGSGFLEWINRLLYSDLSGNYEAIIEEAKTVSPGSNGVKIVPEIFTGGLSGRQGSITGFTHETTRAHIYRAALEALAYYTRFSTEQLQQSGNFNATGIICTGGGSKNALWNQVRANVTGMEVKVPDVPEATALGAAMVAMTGTDVFRSLQEAVDSMRCKIKQYSPDKLSEQYDSLYNHYRKTVLAERQIANSSI